MKEVTNSAIDYAGKAVNIAIGLIGIMALWLGIMKIAEQAGLISIIAKSVKPITKFLFPDVPHDHPAMGSMIMNISANMLGLGNAATPFGLKAMEELEKINPEKGTATNAMYTFLAVNTAGLTLIPATAIAVRAAARQQRSHNHHWYINLWRNMRDDCWYSFCENIRKISDEFIRLN